MMLLIRGCLRKCPCPICLVPLEELHDLSKLFPPQPQEHAKGAFKEWLENQVREEEILKQLGLQPVEVHDTIDITTHVSSCCLVCDHQTYYFIAEHFLTHLVV